MPKRSDEKLKAEIIAALTAGEQPAIVAERYGIDTAKVRVWKQRYVTQSVTNVAPIAAPVTPAPPPVQLEKIRQQNRIGELVLELLAAKLEASKAVAKQATDAEWRRSQRAGELATFGQWLDSTALALGDRLAGGARRADDADPDPDAE